MITAFISPYRSDRASARTIVGEECFLEVFVDAPLATCEERDPKGLYAKARSGEIAEFTGINAPYEAPEPPDLRLATAECSGEECIQQIVLALEARGFLRG